MIKIKDKKDSDVFLASVDKDLYEKNVFINVGSIIKIGNEICYRPAIFGKTLNTLDKIKVNRKINKIVKELNE